MGGLASAICMNRTIEAGRVVSKKAQTYSRPWVATLDALRVASEARLGPPQG